LAHTGAAARVKVLQEELDSLYDSFPGLRAGRRRGKQAGISTAAPAPAPAGTEKIGRKRSGWSAAKRKAAADRMRKYWAARKAAASKTSKTSKKQ
jgi:hypothetical protein